MKNLKSILPPSRKISKVTDISTSPAAQLIRFSRILCVLILVLAAQQLLFAAPGDLDLTFDADGKVLTTIGAGVVTGRGMVIQPDGKIVVAGATDLNNSTSDFLVVRYNADGTLDAMFDGDGKATTDFGGRSDAAFAVALQADGRIVVVGYSGTTATDRDFAVARYNADGSLDASFDGDGRATTDFGNLNDEAFSVAIAPTGKIVVGGTTSSRNGDFAVARYLSNGSLDATFDADGLVTIDAFCTGNCSNTFDRGRSVAIAADGKIIVGGDGRLGAPLENVRFAVTRLLDTGAVDTSFGFFGRNTPSSNGLRVMTGMALQTDGKIVLVGGNSSFASQAPNSFSILRLNANGLGDFDFFDAQWTIPNAAVQNYQLNSVAVQPDGKIVAAGNYGANFLIVRHLTNGLRDNFFGNNGVVITNMNPAATAGGAFAVGLQADGKIVAAGNQQSASGGEIAAARYVIDGCAFALSPTQIFVPRVGGTRTFNVTTQPDNCAWTATSGASWVTIVSGTGSGNGTVTFRVALNDTTQTRTTTVTVGGKTITIQQDPGIGTPRRVRFDVDNDGRADIGTVRARSSDGRIDFYTLGSTQGYRFWILQNAQSASLANFKITPADFDGDGTSDPAIWKADNPSVGAFYINDLFGNRVIAFGAAGDVPLPSDWDGDGRADVAVYRPGTAGNPTGHFYYRPATSTGSDFVSIPWGTIGDKPVPADYDGDGKTDAAIFRPSTGAWYVLRSSDGAVTGVAFGQSGDRLVPADYDGDGKTDIAVFREGIWYLNRSTAGFTGVAFGEATDTPVPADYDGDGKADVAVFRNGTWYLQQSTSGFRGVQFGLGSDAPIPAAYLQ
jgi:uncharacterized delta-60 repeat protein